MTRQAVKDALKDTLDKVLDNAVSRVGGVPGVVAMVTDREGNIYEGSCHNLPKWTWEDTVCMPVLVST